MAAHSGLLPLPFPRTQPQINPVEKSAAKFFGAHAQRADELKQAGEAQLHQLERLTDLYTAVQQSQASLVARLDRAAKLHANLQSR